MFGDKRQMESSRYAQAYNFKYLQPRKKNHLGTISAIILLVLVAAFIVALIATVPY